MAERETTVGPEEEERGGRGHESRHPEHGHEEKHVSERVHAARRLGGDAGGELGDIGLQVERAQSQLARPAGRLGNRLIQRQRVSPLTLFMG